MLLCKYRYSDRYTAMDHDQTTSTSQAPTAHALSAQITLFGFTPTPARAIVVDRTRGWRISHTLIALLVAWGAIPIVVWLPPHIPWVLGAFGIGVYLAWKYMTQHHTLLSLEGKCPKCGAAQAIAKPLSLRTPQKLACADCHHDIFLEVDLAG